MKCPCCGAAELIHDTRNMPYTYRGETTIIPAVTGDFCTACGEVILNSEHGDRYSELVASFQSRVNAAIAKVQAITFDSCRTLAGEPVRESAQGGRRPPGVGGR